MIVERDFEFKNLLFSILYKIEVKLFSFIELIIKCHKLIL